MNSKYEPYDPNSITDKIILPAHIRESLLDDVQSLSSLTAERNGKPMDEYSLKITKELEDIQKGQSNHFLYSAIVDHKVIGFGRLIDHKASDSPDLKNSPAGFFIMGVVVAQSYRRKGVGEQLFSHLTKEAKKHGATELYSFINARNLTSKHLHLKLGFQEFSQGDSFLGVTFDGGVGILYRKSLGA